MTRIRLASVPALLATAALLALLAGCHVNVDKDNNGQDKKVQIQTPFGGIHVDKDPNGHDKKVQIDTPFGGIHVNTDKTNALDVGLPLYPHAQPVKDDDNNKSVDVHMGFGNFEMRVRAVSYASPDSQDKVLAFYKKALASYGNVITCRNHEAIGSPSTTAEGLSCAEDNDHNSGDSDGERHHNGNNSGKLELKAGSKRHQHIVSFDDPENGKTRFALVWIDLPTNPDAHSGQSD